MKKTFDIIAYTISILTIITFVFAYLGRKNTSTDSEILQLK